MADSRKLGFGPIAAPAGGVLIVFADDSLQFGPRTRRLLGSAADWWRARPEPSASPARAAARSTSWRRPASRPDAADRDRHRQGGRPQVAGPRQARRRRAWGGFRPRRPRRQCCWNSRDGPLKPDAAADMALGARLRAYAFDRYKTKRKEGDERPAKARDDARRRRCRRARARPGQTARRSPTASCWRAISSTSRRTSSIRTSSRAAPRRCASSASAIEVLDVKAMRKLGMGALLGVGQGSAQDSRARGHALERRQEGNARRSPSSARACASTPAASRSSRPPAWRT